MKKEDLTDKSLLNGYKVQKSFNKNIRKNIKDFYKTKNCVMLVVNNSFGNVKIVVDHKDGRKGDDGVSDVKNQDINDFQPLCKDAKRQICKRCKETDKRWSAKNIKGNPYAFYADDENFKPKWGCVGCYQYDPVEYRKANVQKIIKEACDDVFKKIYPEENL